MEEKILIKNLPENYKWVFGSRLIIWDNNEKQEYIYIQNSELGEVFYDILNGTIKYYEDLLEDYKEKNENLIIKIIIPNIKELIEGYLKGLTVFVLELTEDNINEDEIKSLSKTINLISMIKSSLKNN